MPASMMLVNMHTVCGNSFMLTPGVLTTCDMKLKAPNGPAPCSAATHGVYAYSEMASGMHEMLSKPSLSTSKQVISAGCCKPHASCAC